jgi:Bacterial protein of unknown function (DUF885)
VTAVAGDLVGRFFERLMELRPVGATYHGLHEHDQRLPDGSLAGIEEWRSQLNDLLWGASRIVIDVELSCGRMSFAEAVAMLMERAALTREGAEAEVRRYTYTPAYQLSYLYGKHLLVELRDRRRRVEGGAFDLRAFHDRLLYAGALPASSWDALF